MAESITEISKMAMQYQMLAAEISAKRIAMANVPVDKNSSVSMPNINAQLFAQLLNQDGGIDQSTNFEQSTNVTTKKVFEPNNPMADSDGFVTYADIDVAAEFVKMTLAKRAYEANIRVYNNASSMKSKALDIGKN